MADGILRPPLVVTTLFLFGTLRNSRLLDTVAGEPLAAKPAELQGFRTVWANGERFPLLVEDETGKAPGIIVEVSDSTLSRLDFYELGFGYDRRAVSLSPDITREAQVYFPTVAWEAGEPFDIDDWSERYEALAVEAATELMGQFGRKTHDEVARIYPQMVSRADSRLRAKARPSPAVFDLPSPDVDVSRTEWPYCDYFAVREDWLRFPTFDGRHSQEVKRATFLGGDAVTVLPYDPARDAVLLVRQFRHGPFCRGDLNPWTLEPIAGRVDAGETPEETAQREMTEETNVTASRLFEVGRYYPSPGAYSEWLVSYVALADLSGADGTVSGVAGEAEDIMSHVVPVDRLMDMIADGSANTGPLILSAFWLQSNKTRLASVD